MPHLLIAIILAAVLLVIWVVTLIVGFPWLLAGLASAAAVLIAGLVEAAGLALAWKKGRNPAGDATAAARGAVKALHQRWMAELPALRTVQSAGKALLDQPWYLVIGATGTGKTRLLQDSGLSFVSNAARPAGREPVPTQSFDWWCTPDGAWLDVAGRIVTDPRAQPEWRHLLRLVRRTRGAPPLNGILLCVDLGQLITTGKSALAEATALRERLDEATAVLGWSVPLYVVFTKSDTLGGFKDFAAALRRTEKDQVLGATIAWPPGDAPAGNWKEEHRRLTQSLLNRRLPALAAATGDEGVRKLFQFPIQFQAAGRFVQDWLDALSRPGLHATAPLRGAYFTSCFHVQRLDTGAGLAARDVQAPDKSVFLAAQSSIANATVVQEALDHRQGFFVRGLLTKLLPLDRGMAHPTAGAHLLARQARWLCLGAAPLVALVMLTWIAITGWRQTSLVAEVRTPADQLRAVSHDAPDDVARNIEALDRLGDRVASLLRADNGRLAPAIDGVAGLYLARLRELLLDPCVTVVIADLSRLRTAPGATVGKGSEQDALYDLFRGYQMLTGAIPADEDLLTRVLNDKGRWLTGIETAKTAATGKAGERVAVDYHTVGLAKRQLSFLPRLLQSGRGRIETDRRLVDAITKDLGESLWLRRGYDDLIRAVKDQFPEARSGLIDGQTALATGYSFTLVYSQRGWDDAIRRGIDEKAAALERTFRELDIALPRPEIARRLTALYLEDHRTRWLQLIGSLRAAGARDLRDVPELITRLAAKGSPYPDFIRAAVKQLDLRTNALQLFGTGEDFAWIEPALRSLGELRKDVEVFLGGTEPVHRGADATKVKALAERFAAVQGAIGEATAGLQPEDKRDAIRGGFASLLRSLWQPLDHELAEEMDARWGAQVAAVWESTAAGRFPFAVEGTEEVSLAQVAKLLNPVSGVLWQVAGPIEQLRAAKVAGAPAMTLDPAYETALTKARRLGQLLFAGNSETVNAPLTLTLVQREGIEDIAFGIGAQGCSLYQRPDARYTLALKQGEPPVVKVAVRILKGQWRTREATQAWGLLRLLRAGSPVLQPNGGYLLTWPVETAIDGKAAVFKACAVLEPTGFEQAVFGDALSGFTLPQRILPAKEP